MINFTSYQDVDKATVQDCIEYITQTGGVNKYYLSSAIEKFSKNASKNDASIARYMYEYLINHTQHKWYAHKVFSVACKFGAFTDDELVKATKNKSVDVVSVALGNLEHLGIPFIEKYLDHKSPSIRTKALDMLMKMGWKNFGKAIALAEKAKGDEAGRMAGLLGEIGDIRAIGCLFRIMDRGQTQNSYCYRQAIQSVKLILKNNPMFEYAEDDNE